MRSTPEFMLQLARSGRHVVVDPERGTYMTTAWGLTTPESRAAVVRQLERRSSRERFDRMIALLRQLADAHDDDDVTALVRQIAAV